VTHILALLYKPNGRGKHRCWRGFLLDTGIQSIVEQFMCDIFQDNYFLVDPSKLERNAVGNMVYAGLWVQEIPVRVETVDFYKTTFTLPPDEDDDDAR
jgi:hypothetical protein